MLTHGSILVSLLWLVEQIPTPPPPIKRQRGRQEFYPYSDTYMSMLCNTKSCGHLKQDSP